MIINPYANVNWGTVQKIVSCSHEHCESQAQCNTLTATSGIKHICISNYYPSVPLYPIDETYTVPEGCISSPNAEHHSMTIKGTFVPAMHLNGLGSFFESGNPRGVEPVGCNGENCAVIIKQILEQLQYSDGGGVTINHPTWSGLNMGQIKYLLDLDDRVLGLEIFNTDFENQSGENMEANIQKWDSALKTGRRCWGFCVADHEGQSTQDWLGRNVLLVNSFDEHSCLQAYRNGEFYGQIRNSNLAFTNISFNNGVFSVSTENATKIIIVIDGHAIEYNGNEASVSVPSGATYIRAEGRSATDYIFSNPVMLKTINRRKSNMTRQILLMS